MGGHSPDPPPVPHTLPGVMLVRRSDPGRRLRYGEALAARPRERPVGSRHRPVRRDAKTGAREVLRRATHKVGLQELNYEGEFDGALCLDSMENVPPEDWPRVLGNLCRALKSGGHLYFTTELEDGDELSAAYEAGRRMGLPLVEGEHPFVSDPRAGEVREGGYHYYPPVERVEGWTRAAGFEPLEKAVEDGYFHLLVRKG